MKRSPIISSLLLALFATSVSAVTLSKQLPPIKVLAAGSLTGAMTAVAKLYTEQTGQKFDLQFGPAGLLRERIEGGEQADLYASANMEHPQALADHGVATQPIVLLRNRVCAKALPEFGLTTDNLLDRLLDPKVGLGTSTPKADPGGDYAWMLFAKAEKVRPGAQAILEAKAQQLVGGRNGKPAPNGQNAMEYAYAQKTVQISLGYCSSRQTTPDPKYTSVELPSALTITPNYGLSVITRDKKSHEAAYKFALFLLSPQAQKVIAQYGFTPVTVPASN
jgi:molybdenum ABC transporter molybdate-binding protein